jgi:hypothetical protein
MTTAALDYIKERGYSLRVINRKFYVEPHEVLGSVVLEAISHLREPLIDSLTLMDEVKRWAGDDSKKWAVLLKLVEKEWDPTFADTLGGTLVDWTGNRMSYSRGLQHAKTSDISFFGRVVENIERKVPEALVQEKKVATRLRRKVT